jgi:diphthine-ammonia ligase
MSYIVSWSGGKESCLACYEAMRRGYQISHLVNFISRETGRVSFHDVAAGLIRLQSEAMGISLVQPETTWDGYEREFKAAVRRLIPAGVEGMVFGDIYMQEHLDWVEKVCGDLGIRAVEPLWGRSTQDIISAFVDAGFEAIVVAAQAALIGEEWLGRRVDESFINYLKANNIDLCGENGEYHTLVTGGPIFHRKIEVAESRVINRNNYRFLNAAKFKLVDRPAEKTYKI